jgi:hypothetical protein
LGNILATIIIPVFGNYVFYWEVYSGAALEWPDTYSWQVALVDHGWAYKLVGALASVEICCLVLFILLHSQRIGLSGDIRGIAGLMDLLEEFYAASLKLPSSSDSWSLSKMEEKFASSEFRLIKGKLKVTKVVEGPRSVTSNFYSSDSGKAISRVTQRVTKRCEWLSPIIEFFDGGSNFFPFRRIVFPIWLVLLFLLMLAAGWITASLNKNAKDQEWNYGIPLDPTVYLIVGIFVQVSLHLCPFYRAVSPWAQLTTVSSQSST